LDTKNDLNRNPETSEHFSEIRRAEEKISLISGSSLSVTFSLSNEANTNLIAHNNDRLEPEIREIFSSALLISEKCSDVSGFLFKSFFVSKFASFDSKK
jgi:hypothetical protein